MKFLLRRAYVANRIAIWQSQRMNEIEPYEPKVVCLSRSAVDANVPNNWFSLRGVIFFAIGMSLGYFFIGF